MTGAEDGEQDIDSPEDESETSENEPDETDDSLNESDLEEMTEAEDSEQDIDSGKPDEKEDVAEYNNEVILNDILNDISYDELKDLSPEFADEMIQEVNRGLDSIEKYFPDIDNVDKSEKVEEMKGLIEDKLVENDEKIWSALDTKDKNTYNNSNPNTQHEMDNIDKISETLGNEITKPELNLGSSALSAATEVFGGEQGEIPEYRDEGKITELTKEVEDSNRRIDFHNMKEDSLVESAFGKLAEKEGSEKNIDLPENMSNKYRDESNEQKDGLSKSDLEEMTGVENAEKNRSVEESNFEGTTERQVEVESITNKEGENISLDSLEKSLPENDQITIKTNEYTMTIHTDEKGRPEVYEVSEIKLLEGNRNNYEQKKMAEYKDTAISDDAGHVLAREFGGLPHQINLLPMNSNINRNSNWRDMEMEIKNAINNGKEITDFKVRVHYDPDSSRPHFFDVSCKQSGMPCFFTRIENKFE